MAVVYVEGFDAYNGLAGNPGSASAGGWAASSTTYQLLAAGRFGGQAYYKNNNGTLTGSTTGITGVGVSQGCLGFAINFVAIAATRPVVSLVTPGAATGLLIFTTAAGAIQIYRNTNVTGGGTLLGSSADGIVTLNTWHYIEMEFVVSDTVGSINVYLNGGNVISVSGVDTRASTTSSLLGTIVFGDYGSSSGGAGAYYIDDIYITDTATRLGEQKVETLRPSADTAQKQWTASTGADNFAMLDETLMSNTDFVSANTVGAYDLYEFVNLSTSANSISAVTISALAQKIDVGTRAISLQVKSGSTTSDGANNYLSGSYSQYSRILNTDPNTSSAWSTSAINAIQAGIKVTI